MTKRLKDIGMALSGTWERIQQAHDHTTAATAVRDAGLHREFGLIALSDLADVKDLADEMVKLLAVHLVRDLNVSGATVAQQAGVTAATISRWTRTDDDDE